MKIKAETPARRCEICHKADLFVPETNYCSRCAGLRSGGDKKVVTVRSYQVHYGPTHSIPNGAVNSNPVRMPNPYPLAYQAQYWPSGACGYSGTGGFDIDRYLFMREMRRSKKMS